jgi:hypothetical protein
MVRPTLPILALLALAGCASTGPEIDQARARLERARSDWESQGIHGYRYDVRRDCFCGWVLPVRITAVGDEIREVRDLETDELVAEERFSQYYTIDDLFDLAERALDREADRFEFEYHPSLHFPTRITIDFRFNVADDEITVFASNLVELLIE